MDRFSHSPHIPNQFRYVLTSLLCSAAPPVVIALLPEPWHTSLLPLAALFGAYAIMFGLGVLLYGLEWMWRLRPWQDQQQTVRCPACYTTEQPYRRFHAVQVAPHVLRVQCIECHERWLQYR